MGAGSSRRNLLIGSAALVFIAASVAPARADYVTFTGGAQMWVESWELRDGHYVFRVYGGVMSVARDRVLKIERESDDEKGLSTLKSQESKLEVELKQKLRALEQAEDELASRPNPEISTLKRDRIERLREEIQQLKERLGR